MIINKIYEHQNLLSLELVSFLVGLRTYQHPCSSRNQATRNFPQNTQTILLAGETDNFEALYIYIYIYIYVQDGPQEVAQVRSIA